MRLFRLEEMETRLKRILRELEAENDKEKLGNIVTIQIPKIKHLL